MDKLSAMQTFVRVAETGTFTKAADSLGVPKATVTRLVQGLEAQLQTKLLNRTTRRVTITPEGAYYLERTLRLLGELADIESSLSGARSNPRGRLRVGAPSAVAQALLIPHLSEFHERYPDIQIDLDIGDRRGSGLAENIDCALRAGEITDLDLVARRIGEFQTILCAAPSYLKLHGNPRDPGEIEGRHRVVNYLSQDGRQPARWILRRGDQAVEVNAGHLIAVNDSGACLAAGVAGLGIVATAPFKAYSHIVNGTLVPVLPEWGVGTIPLHLVYPPNRHLSARVRVFIDWVATLFARDDLIQRGFRQAPSSAEHERIAAAVIADARESSMGLRA